MNDSVVTATGLWADGHVAGDLWGGHSSLFNITNLSSSQPLEGPEEHLFSDILGVWITGIFCLLGFTGNILSFIVLLRAFGRSPMFFVLRAVAVSDGVFLFCVFFIQTMVNVYPKIGILEWCHTYRAYIQCYVWPILMTTQMSTVWLTVLVSLERYVAICYPLRAASICTMSKLRRAVTATFTISILYNIPRYFEMYVEEGTILAKTSAGNNAYYRYIYNCVMYSLFLYFVPLLLLIFLNVKLVLALRQGKKQWQSLQFRQKKEQNLTIIPLTIVLVFFVCGTPALTVNVIDSISPQVFYQQVFINLMLVGNFLVVLNSASNFVIYCLLGKKFRSKLLELCRCACCRDNYRVVHQLVNQTQISDF